MFGRKLCDCGYCGKPIYIGWSYRYWLKKVSQYVYELVRVHTECKLELIKRGEAT